VKAVKGGCWRTGWRSGSEPMPDRYRRHDLAWLRRDWARSLATPLEAGEMDAVDAWRRRSLPLVVARRQPGDAADTLRLGVHVTARAIARSAPPLTLEEALVSAPEAWQPRLGAFARVCAAQDMPAWVFGSLAWQTLSGDRYLRPGSDIDLLFQPRSRREVEQLIALLAEFDTRADPPRLDGEIVLPDCAAVAWRELFARPSRVLVKGPAGVELRPFTAVIDLFGGRQHEVDSRGP
jgi:phosphoribosyl-dephospho-CoA transferase